MSERFLESVKCKLTMEERNELSDKIAYAQLRIAEAERELKSAQTQIKSRIAADQAIMAEAAEQIRSGYEFRKVACEEVKDFEEGVASVIRLDTGEVVRSRKLAPQEYQKELPLEETEASPAESSAEEDIPRIKVSDEEYEPIEAAYSADILSEKNKIRKPFEWEGKQRTNLGGLHWGDYAEAQTWELISIAEWEGKTYSREELYDECDQGTRERGDHTGQVVTWHGTQYVLANPLIFATGEKPVVEEAEEEEERTEAETGESRPEPMQSI